MYKQCVAPKKSRFKIQDGSREMAVIVGLWKKKHFNNNSGEFELPSPHFTRIWHQIYLNCHY